MSLGGTSALEDQDSLFEAKVTLQDSRCGSGLLWHTFTQTNDSNFDAFTELGMKVGMTLPKHYSY